MSRRALQLFVTEGAEGYLGGKTAEPFIASSEATGSGHSLGMPGFESLRLVAGIILSQRSPMH